MFYIPIGAFHVAYAPFKTLWCLSTATITSDLRCKFKAHKNLSGVRLLGFWRIRPVRIHWLIFHQFLPARFAEALHQIRSMGDRRSRVFGEYPLRRVFGFALRAGHWVSSLRAASNASDALDGLL